MLILETDVVHGLPFCVSDVAGLNFPGVMGELRGAVTGENEKRTGADHQPQSTL